MILTPTNFLTLFLVLAPLQVGSSSNINLYIPFFILLFFYINKEKYYYYIIIISIIYIFLAVLQMNFYDFPIKFKGILTMIFIATSALVILEVINLSYSRYEELINSQLIGNLILMLFLISSLQIFMQIVGVREIEKDLFLPFKREAAFYNEPSHVAPLLSAIFYGLYKLKLSVLYWLLFIMQCLISLSGTLVVGILISTIFIMSPAIKRIIFNGKLNIKLLLQVASFLFIVVSTILLVPKVQARFVDIWLAATTISANAKELNSLSAIVFIRGVLDSIVILDSYPMGVGMQNYHLVSGISGFGSDIAWAANSNRNSGASFVFKVIGEYGFIGVIFIIFAIAKIYMNLKDLDREFVIIMVLVSFFRSPDYFTPAFIIMSVGIFTKTRQLKT